MKAPRSYFPNVVAGYRMPNCLESADDLARLHHRDLSRMSSSELYDENLRIQTVRTHIDKNCALIYTDSVLGFVLAYEWIDERARKIRSMAVKESRR